MPAFQPCRGKPAVRMIGGIEETSASYEARSAPRSYSTSAIESGEPFARPDAQGIRRLVQRSNQDSRSRKNRSYSANARENRMTRRNLPVIAIASPLLGATSARAACCSYGCCDCSCVGLKSKAKASKLWRALGGHGRLQNFTIEASDQKSVPGAPSNARPKAKLPSASGNNAEIIREFRAKRGRALA
jgi:hypothetical protein